MEITQAIKSEEDIEKIVKVTEEHPNFSPYFTDEIKKMIDRQQFFLAYEGRELLGFSAVSRIKKHWSELSLIYVFEKHRGKKIGSLLLDRALSQAEGKKFLAGSRNIILKDKFSRSGFKKISLILLPLGIIFFLIKRQGGSWPRLKDTWRKVRQGGFGFFVKYPR